ncbi:hypothetical protein BC936DRAFT_146927 [Jimgerdemannia flammicorona]|uniref:Uncharacterized protein n=1 Tax=Jimgerdemannia flammicorona TaxID=994334 RepID=A0A433D6G7_9FUNG|nr:hypothetical protein BC936DRAFT_146927 [Jimgerdemannia flammicorona]
MPSASILNSKAAATCSTSSWRTISSWLTLAPKKDSTIWHCYSDTWRYREW